MAADARRIVVTTTSSPSPTTTAAAAAAASTVTATTTTTTTLKAAARLKAVKTSTKTTAEATAAVNTRRFQLALAESNDRMCPEFNYGELIGRPGREVAQKNGTEAPVVAIDAFGADVDEVEDEKLKALARKYEEKYAPKPSRVNKMGRMEDYIDLGMGYDETDPFIDNTDAYDELVPSTLTTQYGGFYINSGKLDFKEVQTDSSDELIDPAKRKKRQRLKEMEKEARKRRRLLMKVDSGEHAPKKRGRKPLDRAPSHDGALLKQKKKQETVAVLLQQRKAQQHHHVHQMGGQVSQPLITVSTSASPSPSPSPPTVVTKSVRVNPSHSANTSSSAEETPPSSHRNQTLQLPTVHLVPEITIINDFVGTKAKSNGSQQPRQQAQPNALINDIIESVILASREQRASMSGEFSNNAALVELVSSDSDNPSIGATSGVINPLEMETAPKLPDGLPDVLDEAIKQIKVAALKSGEGKCRFFSNEVNNMLLSIELMSRELSCSQRSTLFGHLASHLPCTKETLLKRAKKLRLDQEDVKLREILAQLKTAIYDVMPTMEDSYKTRCLTVARDSMNESDGSDSSDEYWEEDGSPSPDEGNVEMNAGDGIATGVRRKFIWNDKLRTLLCDAVQIKLRCFEMSKTRTQSIDKYLRRFFDLHIKGLWPNGWMHSRKLMKESRLVHAHLTCRHRKNLMLGGKKFVLPAGAPMSSSITSGLVIPKSEPLAYDSSSKGGTAAAAALATGQRITSNLMSSSSATTSLSMIAASAATPPLPVRTLSPAHQIQQLGGNPPSSGPMAVDVSSSNAAAATTIAAAAVTTVNADVTPSLKLSNHVFSLLRTDNLVGTSTAEHFIGELIADQLANFPNSSTVGKHSIVGGRNKFHDSALFTAAMIKCGGSPTASNSTPPPSSSPSSKGTTTTTTIQQGKRFSAGNEEPKVSFATPKAFTTKVPTSSERKSSVSDNIQAGVSILKENHHDSAQQRHHSSSQQQQQHRWSTSPDLRVATLMNKTASSSSAVHKNQTSPIKVDMLLAAADCLGAMGSSKTLAAAVAPYHSLFDIQGAIERGLQGQQSSASSQHSNHALVSPKVSSSSRSSSNYHYADAPLNFSTPRGSVDKMMKTSSSSVVRTSVSSSPNTSSGAHSYVTMFSDKKLAASAASVVVPIIAGHNMAPSVRTVNLPQQLQPTKKYVSLSQPRHLKSDSQDVLEGIAAAVHEQHIKKTASPSQRSLDFVTSTHRSKNISSASEGNSTGGNSGGRHVKPNTNHNHNHHHFHHHHHASASLPKVTTTMMTSGYCEPTHSVHQGTKDLSTKQRCNRPTTSSSSPS